VKPKAKTCKYHCRGCHSHFASLTAFDAHRKGDYSSRSCELPDEENGFVGVEGECRIASSEVLHPVLIWALVADRERLAGAFG
jgi:hypothetical protein